MLIDEIFYSKGPTFLTKFVKSISSSGKTMYISYKKQHLTGKLDFTASIKYKKINLECQSWLKKNVLISPNNPNINCSWIITRKFESYITLDFDFIEVKPIGNYYNINKLNYNSL